MPQAESNLGRTRPSADARSDLPGTAGPKAALATGGLLAVLASVCCVGPLVLVSLSIGGAWASNLTLLEPFRPFFLGIAAIALAFAYRRIFRPAAECKAGEVCAVPKAKRSYKIMFWVVAGLVLASFSIPYVAPLFY
jgi:mercuric ion transport protein